MEVEEEAGGGMENITIKEYNSSTLNQCGKLFFSIRAHAYKLDETTHKPLAPLVFRGLTLFIYCDSFLELDLAVLNDST